MKECTLDVNFKECTCTYASCQRRGHCCACILYHRRRVVRSLAASSVRKERRFGIAAARPFLEIVEGHRKELDEA